MKARTLGRAAIAAAALIGPLGLASCGSDDQSADTTVAASADVVIDGAWARTSAAGADMGAAYMTISSTAGDRLVDVRVDATVAEMAQIHEVVMAGGDMDTDDTMMTTDSTAAPEMVMQEVDEIVIAAGGMTELKPGGYHIMLMKLAAPLEAGSTIDVTLVFADAGEKTITIPVRDDAP